MKHSKTPRLENGQVPPGLPEKPDCEKRKHDGKQKRNKRGRGRTDLSPDNETFEVFGGP